MKNFTIDYKRVPNSFCPPVFPERPCCDYNNFSNYMWVSGSFYVEKEIETQEELISFLKNEFSIKSDYHLVIEPVTHYY